MLLLQDLRTRASTCSASDSVGVGGGAGADAIPLFWKLHVEVVVAVAVAVMWEGMVVWHRRCRECTGERGVQGEGHPDECERIES